MIKAIAVLALFADCLTWAAIGRPVVAACWAAAAIAVAILVPAR